MAPFILWGIVPPQRPHPTSAYPTLSRPAPSYCYRICSHPYPTSPHPTPSHSIPPHPNPGAKRARFGQPLLLWKRCMAIRLFHTHRRRVPWDWDEVGSGEVGSNTRGPNERGWDTGRRHRADLASISLHLVRRGRLHASPRLVNFVHLVNLIGPAAHLACKRTACKRTACKSAW